MMVTSITSEQELVDVLRAARLPYCVKGGGTRGMLGAHALLSTQGLRGIRLYEPGALTLVAAAGTPLDEVTATLATQKQQLAFEPADWRGLLGSAGEPTVGGMIAANISGPRRVRAGAARDAVLGVRFVDGTGALIKSGGRVMKNVTGYDLARLMAGSHGTLGVLTEVALKVQPMHEAIATLLIDDLGLTDAVAAMTQALMSPYEVTGAARSPEGQVAIRIEGLAASVAYRTGRLAELLATYGSVTVVGGPGPWSEIRDLAGFIGKQGDVWRFSVTPSQAPEIASRLGGDLVLDWGGGLIWALLPEGSDARSMAAPYCGHATLVRAGVETRARLARFEPEAPSVASLTQLLRKKFDPRGVLNPGLMG